MNPIIDKIQKLLALAGSNNEAEAKLAMSRAQELLAKHCLSLHDLETDQIPEIKNEVYKVTGYASRGLQKVLPWLCDALSPIFGTRIMVHAPNQAVIYGFPKNIELHKFAMDSIINQAQAYYREGYKTNRTITFDEVFWKSFSDTIGARYKENKEICSGIVLYDPIKAHCDRLSQGRVTLNSLTDSSAGLAEGNQAGNSVSINPGIQAGFQGNLLK